MDLYQKIQSSVEVACNALFSAPPQRLQVQPTNPEFEGSHTLVCFPLVKQYRKKPDEVASSIGDYLVTHTDFIASYNVVKGFLNLVIADQAWITVFGAINQQNKFGHVPPTGKEIIIEFSSPNTNKPLHLGHLRNNFLGSSVSALYESQGYQVYRVQIINDRGIHICKSMVAWQNKGSEETPQSSGLKGDKLVGNYYVEFDGLYKKEVADLIASGTVPKQAEKEAPIMKQAVHMLMQWEKKDPEVIALWKTMNAWVYAGFEATYKKMGVDFDKLYFESETYLLGKQEVMKGLEQGVFFRKKDGSVWVDLTDEGLDQKILLRSDGTSVYMTQDIGTAILRYRDFPKIVGQIYTVGNEQEYHFKVLFLILKKLKYPWADACYHLSYGMVDLPSGKMKSREGIVVDADDLMQDMVDTARDQTQALGKIDDLSQEESARLFETIGMGALKYYLLKVDPRKRITFDPNESIKLQGHTGPFIQYTYARIRSILRKTSKVGEVTSTYDVAVLLPVERELIQQLVDYPARLQEATHEHSPAVVANYAYELAKIYNRLYQTVTILGEEDMEKLKFRVSLSQKTGEVIKSALRILHISVPERM